MKSTRIQVHMKGIGDTTFKHDSGGVKCVIYSKTMPICELILGTLVILNQQRYT